jgi:hypothetical protein
VRSSGSAPLVDGGLLMLDVHGGAEAMLEQVERTRNRGFTHVWDQASFDPLTHRTVCRIHHEFRDGSRLADAFVYHWRLWTLPELQEVMAEAGFRDIHVLWELTDRKTKRGAGVFRRIDQGPPSDPGSPTSSAGADQGPLASRPPQQVPRTAGAPWTGRAPLNRVGPRAAGSPASPNALVRHHLGHPTTQAHSMRRDGAQLTCNYSFTISG